MIPAFLKFLNVEFYGVDNDCNLKYSNRVKFCNLDTDSLPFDDNFFDIVIGWYVVEHIKNPFKMLKEIHRVLRPGGHFVFITSNKKHPIFFIVSLFKFLRKFYFYFRFHQKENYPLYLKLNTLNDIKNNVEKLQFKIVKIINLGTASTYFSKIKILILAVSIIEILFDSPSSLYVVLKKITN